MKQAEIYLRKLREECFDTYSKDMTVEDKLVNDEKFYDPYDLNAVYFEAEKNSLKMVQLSYSLDFLEMFTEIYLNVQIRYLCNPFSTGLSNVLFH